MVYGQCICRAHHKLAVLSPGPASLACTQFLFFVLFFTCYKEVCLLYILFQVEVYYVYSNITNLQ